MLEGGLIDIKNGKCVGMRRMLALFIIASQHLFYTEINTVNNYKGRAKHTLMSEKHTRTRNNRSSCSTFLDSILAAFLGIPVKYFKGILEV